MPYPLGHGAMYQKKKTEARRACELGARAPGAQPPCIANALCKEQQRLARARPVGLALRKCQTPKRAEPALQDTLAEWSKAPDSSSGGAMRWQAQPRFAGNRL